MRVRPSGSRLKHTPSHSSSSRRYEMLQLQQQQAKRTQAASKGPAARRAPTQPLEQHQAERTRAADNDRISIDSNSSWGALAASAAAETPKTDPRSSGARSGAEIRRYAFFVITQFCDDDDAMIAIILAKSRVVSFGMQSICSNSAGLDVTEP